MGEDCPEVLFIKGENDDDPYDDSLLIEYWDACMATFKDNVNKPAESERKEWKVGDPCQAEFDEEGVFYEATILSIIRDKCMVQFYGYGDTMEMDLKDLRVSKGKHRRKQQEIEAKLYLEEEEDFESKKESSSSDKVARGSGNDTDDEGSSDTPPPINKCKQFTKHHETTTGAVRTRTPSKSKPTTTSSNSAQYTQPDSQVPQTSSHYLQQGVSPSRQQPKGRSNQAFQYLQSEQQHRKTISQQQQPLPQYLPSQQPRRSFPDPAYVPPDQRPHYTPLEHFPRASGYGLPHFQQYRDPYQVHNIPSMIPPPPPPRCDEPSDELSSMLMSWYISGYQTGYYMASRDHRTQPRH